MPVTTTVERNATGATQAEWRPYEPRGAALELLRNRTRELLLSGPAGTGKSRACLEKLNIAANNYPKMRGAIVRKVRRTLTQSAMVTFEEKVLPDPSPVKFHEVDQEYRYPNGSRVIVAGLDDPDKIKSTEFDVVYVQEATELDQGDWEMLLSRLRNGRMPYQQVIADCNPADPHHWLKLRCDDGKTTLLESRHEDNPSVTDEYLATLDSLTGFMHQRLRLGLWVAAEGMFFTEWNPDMHVVQPFDVPDHWVRWLAVDYGYRDPFCCLFFARAEDENRTVYVTKELYGPGLRDEQQAKLIHANLDPRVRYAAAVGDPSMFNTRGEQDKPSIASVYHAHGVPLAPATNARVEGWQTVRRALAMVDGRPPRLKVFDTCANLIRTIPAMVHDPFDKEDLADRVGNRKTDDHAVDPLRYGLMMETAPPARPPHAVGFDFT